jgi:hypothetical protein
MMFEDYPELLKPQEVADILRVSKRIIYQYANEGVISSFRPAGPGGKTMRRVLIPKWALINYLGGDLEERRTPKRRFGRRV